VCCCEAFSPRWFDADLSISRYGFRARHGESSQINRGPAWRRYPTELHVFEIDPDERLSGEVSTVLLIRVLFRMTKCATLNAVETDKSFILPVRNCVDPSSTLQRGSHMPRKLLVFIIAK
jgi:hypothetical protein